MMKKQALISVSDKAGVVDFARALAGLGYRILSTGGTARLLAESGIEVTEVAEYTGFPEMLDGRVKTLNPRIHAGLLARRPDPAHMQALAQHAIDPIEILVVNLYPFERTVADPDCSFDDAIENIDIGGPAMLRAAAKNHESVAAVVDPADYASVLDELRAAGAVGAATRLMLAKKVFAHTARYDGMIANYLTSLDDEQRRGTFPEVLTRQWVRVQQMRYGENPHQSAAFYREHHGRRGAARWLCAAAGQGTVVQQHRRRRCGVGVRAQLRSTGVRHRQARQPVRRRGRRITGRRIREGVQDRSHVGVRWNHCLQPACRRRGSAGGGAPVRRGRDCTGVRRRRARCVCREGQRAPADRRTRRGPQRLRFQARRRRPARAVPGPARDGASRTSRS